MGKYDGINVAEVTLIEYDRGARAVSDKRRAWVPLLRYAAAAVLLLCAFAGKLAAVPFFEAVSGFIKSAITFELPFMQSNTQPGDGAIAAYIEASEAEQA